MKTLLLLLVATSAFAAAQDLIVTGSTWTGTRAIQTSVCRLRQNADHFDVNPEAGAERICFEAIVHQHNSNISNPELHELLARQLAIASKQFGIPYNPCPCECLHKDVKKVDK